MHYIINATVTVTQTASINQIKQNLDGISNPKSKIFSHQCRHLLMLVAMVNLVKTIPHWATFARISCSGFEL